MGMISIMLRELKNKVVFVTGSARRVGREIALEFARHGAHLVIHHHQSDQEAAQTAAEARSLGGEALIIKGDHGHYDDIAQNFAEIQNHYGRLDVLVNSAGVFPKTNLLDVPPDEWQHTLDLNLSAPFYCTQFAGRIMRDHGGGVIINIGDNAGARPWAARPHHSITKSAILMLTEVSALVLAEYGIRVNCIIPGPVLMTPGMKIEFWRDQVEAKLPLKRSGNPDDIARAAVFLATNDFITGAILRVDGGEFLHDR